MVGKGDPKNHPIGGNLQPNQWTAFCDVPLFGNGIVIRQKRLDLVSESKSRSRGGVPFVERQTSAPDDLWTCRPLGSHDELYTSLHSRAGEPLHFGAPKGRGPHLFLFLAGQRRALFLEASGHASSSQVGMAMAAYFVAKDLTAYLEASPNGCTSHPNAL